MNKENEKIKWIKDGEVVDPLSNPNIKIEQDGKIHRLIILKAMPSDEGKYQAKATGASTHCNALINGKLNFCILKFYFKQKNDFLELPVEFVTKLKDIQAKEKETVRFECALNREISDIKWLKSGIEIKPDETKYRIFNEGNKAVLEILDCQLDDASDYAIVARGRKSVAKLNVEGCA